MDVDGPHDAGRLANDTLRDSVVQRQSLFVKEYPAVGPGAADRARHRVARRIDLDETATERGGRLEDALHESIGIDRSCDEREVGKPSSGTLTAGDGPKSPRASARRPCPCSPETSPVVRAWISFLGSG